MSKETTQSSDWKDGFLFVGNSLILDFVNTRPIQDGKPYELLPDFLAVIRWFRAMGALSERDSRDLQQWEGFSRGRHIWKELVNFREEIRTELLSWERDGKIGRHALEKINYLLSKYPMLTQLGQTGDKTHRHQTFNVRVPENLFAPLAYSAAELFAEQDRSRIRKCGQCVLHFLDTSKKGTRRWCSMRLCGNRLKVAAYAARKRAD